MTNTNKVLGLLVIAAAALLVGILLARATSTQTLPPVVSDIDINRYEGQWFSYAEIPQKYTEGCTCTRAMYQLTNENSIIVTNKCLVDGTEKVSKGEAVPVDDSGARYKIRFEEQPLPFISGSYNIITVAPDYRYALVGSNERDALWILSRERTLSQDDYTTLVQIATVAGYDATQLVPTDLTTCPS